MPPDCYRDCCRDMSRNINNGEGSVVCSICGLVQEAALEGIPIRGQWKNGWETSLCERAKNQALKEFGFRFTPRSMEKILVDWVENGLLPSFVLNKTIYRAMQILDGYRRPEAARRKGFCSLTEFSAIILYGTLLEERIPRSVNLVSGISGVPVKRLWNLDEVFYPNMELERISGPSDWMSGICYFLPISYKEGRNVCRVANLLYRDFSFRALTVLSVVIYAYLEMRHAKYPNKKRLPKKQLCEITGVSVTSLMRGVQEMFGKKPSHPSWNLIKFELRQT